LQYYKKALVKNDNPALTQRYARLLQVRDSRAKVSVPQKVAQATTAKKVLETTVENVALVAKVVTEHAVVTKESHATGPKASASPLPKQVNEEMPDNHAVVDVYKPNEEKDVLAGLEAWRVAWQTQNLDAYFSAYASDYVPTGRYASLSAWKSYKKRVIGNKSYIKVDLSNINVALSEDKKVVRIRFNQTFRSNSYNGDDVKVLKLEKRQQGWKIVREALVF